MSTSISCDALETKFAIARKVFRIAVDRLNKTLDMSNAEFTEADRAMTIASNNYLDISSKIDKLRLDNSKYYN